MTDFRQLFSALARAGVEYVLIGGVAATVHGSARLTQDVDVVYRRTSENIARIVAALAPLNPYLRGAPAGLPFRFDEQTLRSGLNFTLTTDAGSIDLIAEAAGGFTWESLDSDALEIVVFDVPVRTATLSSLLAMKRAAGRPKDLEVISELESLREENGSDSPC